MNVYSLFGSFASRKPSGPSNRLTMPTPRSSLPGGTTPTAAPGPYTYAGSQSIIGPARAGADANAPIRSAVHIRFRIFIRSSEIAVGGY